MPFLTSSAVGDGGTVAGCDCLLKWQVVAELCDVSITQFLYTDSLQAASGQGEMKATTDVLI